MAEDGYVLLRGLIPPERILRVRRELLAICRDAGWLDDADGDGVVRLEARCASPDPEYYAVYRPAISLQSFNELAHDPAILDVMEILLEADEDDVLVRPAKLARLVFPQEGEFGATPPHQDFPHEQGTANAYTCWVPFGDCSRRMGSLALWPGSHRHGIYDHGFVPGIGGLGIHVERLEPVWLASDIAAGDVLVFHAMTVHAALPNRTPNRLRLSGDYRYQRVDEPVPEHALSPSGAGLTWDQVYEGWTDDTYQHYWRERPLEAAPYDYSFYDRRDEEVLEQARLGNPETRNMLTAIISRSKDPEKVAEAKRALEELDEALAARSGPV